MAKVRVWNRNDYPLKEMFKGDELTILPGEFCLMELEDAVLLKGQYAPIKVLGDGTMDPKSFKKLHIETVTPGAPTAAPGHACMSCGEVKGSKHELQLHIESRHADQEKLTIDVPAPVAAEPPKVEAKPGRRSRVTARAS